MYGFVLLKSGKIILLYIGFLVLFRMLKIFFWEILNFYSYGAKFSPL